MVHLTKCASVLAAAILLTAGIGMVLFANEESEAVTTQTPIASLVKDADDVYTDYISNGITSYTVAKETYVEITHVVGADYTYEITAVTSSYGDTAGLTYTSPFNNVTGYINKSASGTVSISVEFRDQGDDDEVTITLNVVDTTSSQNDPYFTTVSMPANVFVANSDYYVNLGTSFNVPSVEVYADSIYEVDSVTAGYGLSVSQTSPYPLTGTATSTGTATVTVIQYDSNHIELNTYNISVHINDYNHADIRMIGGETWTYTPTLNITGIVSISGTATVWVSLSAGTISGTAPDNVAIGTTYDLTITANTTDPNQTATQTVTFTVDPQITISGPGTTQVIPYDTGDVGDLISSNFEDGTRAIYSISGGIGYSIDATDGTIYYNNPNSATVTVTASSPYTYSSGATNTASTTVTFTVQGQLTASVSGTLYLVTGMSVPNTPAENVTLSHNDLGAGTYTWSIVGTNNTGVTVASDGTLGGTPGNVGTYNITVRCTSDVGGATQTADATLNVVIVPVLVFLSVPSIGLYS